MAVLSLPNCRPYLGYGGQQVTYIHIVSKTRIFHRLRWSESQLSLKIKIRQQMLTKKVSNFFYVVLACHYPELDAFYEHFQAAVHFHLSWRS